MAPSRPDWSSLLAPELLELIANKLPCTDYVAFRSACSSWRSAAAPLRFPPLMMLPLDPESETISFYSLFDNKVASFPLPEARGAVFCGGSHGWVAFMDAAASVSLLNPFTRSRVRLPPADERIASASQKRVIKNKKSDRWLSLDGSSPTAIGLTNLPRVFFNSIKLSSSPDPDNGEFVAVASLACSPEIAFCRIGDKEWSLLDTNLSCSIRSIDYCHGRFFVMDWVGEVAICDVGIRDTKATRLPSLDAPSDRYHCKILESGKDLLLVATVLGSGSGDGDERFLSYYNEVYKVEFLEEEMRWRKVDGVGESTLFVSSHLGASFGGRKGIGCRENCIYFSEPLYGEGCIEIVDLVDGSSETVVCGREMVSLEGACWFRPSLC